jgi:hypothetical protein
MVQSKGCGGSGGGAAVKLNTTRHATDALRRRRRVAQLRIPENFAMAMKILPETPRATRQTH